MVFDPGQALAVLDRTPATLRALLYRLPRPWILQNEGVGTWSPFDVVGHLIETDEILWIPEVKTFFNHDGRGGAAPGASAAPGLQGRCRGKSIEGLLSIFAAQRAANIGIVKTFNPAPDDFARNGPHAEYGSITLGQLLSSWVVHDLDHLGQIARIMASQYARETGPWTGRPSVFEG